MKIVTWNVNGVRPRLAQIARYVAEAAPDVLCLQETKVQNDQFPRAAFVEMGFADCFIHGQKSYNGVAIAVRDPGAIESRQVFADKDDCRHLAVRLPDGLTVHNFYVPSGGDEPDPTINAKFDQKLRFIADMTDWFPQQHQPDAPSLLVGDLNVAPLEQDVWNHRVHRKQVGHTEQECQALLGSMAAFGWQDAAREFTPPSQPLFSWWTYRSPGALEKDRGWRLDHAWTSPGLRPRLRDCRVDKTPRFWDQPSDHAPVVVTLD